MKKILRWIITYPERSERWAYRKTAEFFIRRGTPPENFGNLDEPLPDDIEQRKKIPFLVCWIWIIIMDQTWDLTYVHIAGGAPNSDPTWSWLSVWIIASIFFIYTWRKLAPIEVKA